MTLTLDISTIGFAVENGVLTLKMEDDEARRIFRKYLTIDPYSKRSCSTVSEVAERYGFTEKVVRGWLDKGCPFYRIATDIRFDDREVDQWFATKFGRNHKQEKIL